ncbi:MAG: hypothetical protein ACC631_09330, partial [Halocynthiibacter sp.]
GLIQQIAIVRALASEPAILIFDEAYTSIDRITDPLVVAVLAGMKGKRTVIIAAHRPSYLSLADKCVEISGGRLVPLSKNDKNEWIHIPSATRSGFAPSTIAAEMIA